MTCRHGKDDPSCSSHRDYRAPPPYKPPVPPTPDAENYEIVDSYRQGAHLILKVRYPNCMQCAYEGTKILVYLNVSESSALRWKKIDPHFRDPKKPNRRPTESPGPSARFPASEEGWEDAKRYVAGKELGQKNV